jgi:flagellar biogenesis protein FliO
LDPPGSSGKNPSGGGRRGGPLSLVTVGGSLAMVLGLFLFVAWLMRRTTPQGANLLPTGVVEVLGRAMLPNRAQAHLLRVGNKLVLIAATANSVETLTEITDPDEVDRLAGMCQQARPTSVSESFRHMLGQLAGQRTETTSAGHDVGDGALEGRDA